MQKKPLKFLSILLSILLVFQQTGFAQVAASLDISRSLSGLRNSPAPDKFRPIHLRYFSYDITTNNFRILLDKGDLKNLNDGDLENSSRDLLDYFLIGVTLPDDKFWVNLRPDSENNIINDELAKTDIGKILLEADLQLKKDTARFTSPETPEGREYWNKLYNKAGELFGYDDVTIPTLTRPWIVPDEIIIRETKDSAYVYKATLKVLLEQDHLKNSAVYNFDDPRLKEINEYSSQIIRETILPKLTKEINISKRYAPLRQVFYSLILSRWFKSRFSGKNSLYSNLINRGDLTGLTSKEDWSKTTYFRQYQKSFKDGEYNIQEPVSTPFGQTIRSYFSGGVDATGGTMVAADLGAYTGSSGFTIFIKDGGKAGFAGNARNKDRLNKLEDTKEDQKPPESGTAFEEVDEGQVSALISGEDLKRFAELSKQIRERTINAVPDILKQVELDTSGKEAYLDSIARYYEQQFGFPGKSLTVSFPDIAPLSGNEVVFLNKDDKPVAVVKIFLRAEADVPFGGEALREIESSVLLRSKGMPMYFPEIYDIVSANNPDINNQQRPLVVVSAFAQGVNMASRLEDFIKAYSDNDRAEINRIIEEAGLVGEALGMLHNSFPPSAGRDSENTDYDYNRMKDTIKQFFEEGKIGREKYDELNNLVEERSRDAKKTDPEGPPSFSLGDCHSGNFLLKDGKVSIIDAGGTMFWSLDSEYRGTGHPANDLARFIDNLYDRLKFQVAIDLIEELEKAFLEGYSRKRKDIDPKILKDSIYFYKAMTALVAFGYSNSEYDKQVALIRFKAYLNKEDIPELTEKLAGDLYDVWRFARNPNGVDVELSETDRIKGIDIAATEYKDLPLLFQSVIRDSAESVIRLIGRGLAEGKRVTLEEEWIEKASEELKLPDFIMEDSLLSDEAKRRIKRKVIIFGILFHDPLGNVPLPDESGKKLGGIDFRAMNILVQPMGSFSGLDFTLPKLNNLTSIDIDEELGQIQNMVARGIIPSGMRIKELIAACFEKKEINSRADEIMICLADIFRLEEETLTKSSPEIKESLVIIDSNKFVLQ